MDLAGLYARLGEKDLAFYWLNKACEEQGYVRVFLKFDPDYGNLRSDTRYRTLLERVRVP